MDMNIKTDLEKEERTIWSEPYFWNEERDGLFIKRGINYHETMRKIALEVLGDEFKENNPQRK